MAPQPVNAHDATANTDATYSKYCNGRVESLQDQADNGGWLLQGMPINGDAPDLETMGTRGSFKDANDNDSDLYSDNV
jgi:hypothetical protein